jgi:hypothetical protein
MEIMPNKLAQHNIVKLNKFQNDLKDYIQKASIGETPVHEVDRLYKDVKNPLFAWQ